MKQSLVKFHEQAREDIARLVSDARADGEVSAEVNPAHFSMHFTSALFGLSYQWLVNPEAIDVDGFIATLKDHMLLVLRPATA